MSKFTPLDVDNPALRTDILKRFLTLEYKGVHRSIFSATLPPPPAPPPSKVPVNTAPPRACRTASPDRGRKVFWIRERHGRESSPGVFRNGQQRRCLYCRRRRHAHGAVSRRANYEHDGGRRGSFLGPPRNADAGTARAERLIDMMISRPNPSKRKCRHGESGYSLLMVVFLVATTLVLSAAAVPNLLTEGRREREDEMVWRGEQYERAIGMYFQKFGRYPTKIDDLVKQTNGVRFLRQAYTDPMNKEDGSWRFIYVGPNGQLIGSVHSQSLLQSALNLPSVSWIDVAGRAGQPAPPPANSAPGGAIGQFGPQASQQPGQTPGQQPGQLSGTGLSSNPLESQAAAAYGRCNRRKYHWSGKQGEGTISAGL